MNEVKSKLSDLLNVLDQKRSLSDIDSYRIPDLWNTWGYQGDELKRTEQGELLVNPYNFYYEVIKSYILPKKEGNQDYNKPFNQMIDRQIKNDEIGGDWIKESVVYSMMMRTSSAWDHDQSGDLDHENQYGLKDTGTFVKTLALLPLFKKMGVDVVYLLPISKFSLKDKKGELGSPYGVSNFYELDPNLKDPLTGHEFTVEDEFEAFVEACHILGMKVMIDIIPRTNAIENDLIIDHPDWFYWIKSEAFESYFPPAVPHLGSTVSPSPENLPAVYESKEVWEHIRKFSYDPLTIDPVKYDRLVAEYKKDPKGYFSDLIKKEYQIQVAPAFSDHINDPQPPWTDITFFRMYEDHPILTQQELNKHVNEGEEVPPYILFDTIKCNFYQGEKPNMGLWDTLSGVIPYYQERFGIDGARIDMGHALSSELLELIISRARENDPQFCFIAEELNSGNAEKSRKLGYNMIIGDGFWHEPRVKEHRLHKFMERAPQLACPIFACGETHDTPRLAGREGGRKLANMITMLNMFMPNGVPFINSGQEVYETQPINTGLDVTPQSLYMLDENDPYYKKLALFDKFAFHYLNEGNWEIPNQLEKIAAIRQTYLSTITDVANLAPISISSEEVIGFAFVEANKRDEAKDNILMVLANTDFENDLAVTVDLKGVYQVTANQAKLASTLFSQYEGDYLIEVHESKLALNLKSGEVRVIKL